MLYLKLNYINCYVTSTVFILKLTDFTMLL